LTMAGKYRNSVICSKLFCQAAGLLLSL
jgi:hypothetical protein